MGVRGASSREARGGAGVHMRVMMDGVHMRVMMDEQHQGMAMSRC